MAKLTQSNKAEKRRRRATNTAVADWGGVDSELLRAVISSVTLGGGAIRFGYTKDGGAYAIGIYGDGKPFTEFAGSDTDPTEWLTGIWEDYQ